MIRPDLLEILACPETKEPVSVAEEGLVMRLNGLISSGSLNNRAGRPVSELIDGGLVRKDGKILYPVRDAIPIMLVDEAISLENLPA